jgi:hypothetical protein
MRTLLVSTAAGLLAAASVGHAQITLYEHDNFRGNAQEFRNTHSNLDRTSMNDRASSAVVYGGAWQICEHAQFGGRCTTLTRGEYPSLGEMGMNDTVSSVRPVRGGPPPPPPPTRPPTGSSAGRIVLFEGHEFSGGSASFNRPVTSLDRGEFNDRAVSAIVYSGVWEVCEHANFGGDCVHLGPGRHYDLGKVSGRASSLRMIAR